MLNRSIRIFIAPWGLTPAFVEDRNPSVIFCSDSAVFPGSMTFPAAETILPSGILFAGNIGKLHTSAAAAKTASVITIVMLKMHFPFIVSSFDKYVCFP